MSAPAIRTSVKFHENDSRAETIVKLNRMIDDIRRGSAALAAGSSGGGASSASGASSGGGGSTTTVVEEASLTRIFLLMGC